MDIFPKDTPWPKLPIPPLPYPLCNAEIALSVAVEYSGGGDFGKNPNAAFRLGIAGRIIVTGQVEAGPGKAGVEGTLGVTGALTLRGTPQNWSIEGDMGYEGQVNLVAKAGWFEARMPVCNGTIAEMLGISFGGNGAHILHTRQPNFKWGNAIQPIIDFVQGKQAAGSNGQALASAPHPAADDTAMAA
ncbi:MAG TPA: hypothetical protein VFP84_24160 [Kofleriaceae bacterium]|nr:hypothetical protein [Kofleriaceae bacterium]